ncbi:MAG: hypothetical protein RUMPE_00419 [Eubacteriales bacterium SKADARSKE-1]|nr:hypothetical protein [Eubacteriales bacterium SKADARSKE-1]
MIERLNLEQLGMVSGGSLYCIFRDDMVLVCYTDFINNPERKKWVLYKSWEDASVDALNYDARGLESFQQSAPIYPFMVKRAEIEEFEDEN